MARPHDTRSERTAMVNDSLWANRTVLAASSAAVVGVFAGYPFDSVKTRLQSQHYDTIMACVRLTYKEEGIRGFFRGILPPLVTISIIKSISFSVYEETKMFCKQRDPYFSRDTLAATMAVSTLSGWTSGAFIAALSCPFELVKIQKQLEFLLQASSVTTGTTIVRTPADMTDWKHPRAIHTMGSYAQTSAPAPVAPTPAAGRTAAHRTVGAGLPISSTASVDQRNMPPPPKKYNSTRPYASSTTDANNNTRASTSSWASAKDIVKKKGILALYNGFGLHFLRDSLGTGMYFGGYETTKYLLTKKGQTAGPLTQFIAGGVCGILCWLIVFPIDLVKTLKQKEVLATQNQYNSAYQCVQEIVRHRGVRGLYSGISVTLIRAFPIHSLNFLVYEQTLAFLAKVSHHEKAR
ncbi:mitochondrial carrier domain-containing protein [Gongronella butleri]|nr:mitochondrial carrier domain-containing protein [Gongronella butleri]